MRNFILDTGALSLFFAGHMRVNKLMMEIKTEKANGFVPRIILSEFYYKTWQKFGKQAAYIRTNNIRNSKIKECTLDKDDIYDIGEYKIKSSKLSLADCILLNDASKHKCTIITSESELAKIYNGKSIKLEF